MNNLFKISLIALLASFISCTDTNEPFFEDIYVYKNILPNKISIDFYKLNAEKVSVDITDSISISRDHNQFDYTFSPASNDSIIVKFHDGKKIVFKYEPNSFNWNVNAINYSIYKKTYKIKDNLTTQFYTYTIDKKLYELAK
ncbi:hypothetical protein GCM10022216_05080 [Sphingobacterium kyonggiense]|uniref:Lipoprotein n=1 Tax=Sphingobacterium kyonggiense TaxID=714075 RepID=A0ABP7YAE1_9SPHI